MKKYRITITTDKSGFHIAEANTLDELSILFVKIMDKLHEASLKAGIVEEGWQPDGTYVINKINL